MRDMERPDGTSGNRPYLFLSYSHKDTEVLAPLFQNIRADYRVLLDENIKAAREFNEEIARMIQDAALIVCFLSPSYVRSTYCLDEIHYARKKEKPILLIYLEDTVLPDGLELRVSRLEAIDVRDSKCMERLAANEEAAMCRKDRDSQAVPATGPMVERDHRGPHTGGHRQPSIYKESTEISDLFRTIEPFSDRWAKLEKRSFAKKCAITIILTPLQLYLLFVTIKMVAGLITNLYNGAGFVIGELGPVSLCALVGLVLLQFVKVKLREIVDSRFEILVNRGDYESMKYYDNFVTPMNHLSTQLEGNQIVCDIIDWLSKECLTMISSADRGDRIEHLDIAYRFRVYSDQMIRCHKVQKFSAGWGPKMKNDGTICKTCKMMAAEGT